MSRPPALDVRGLARAYGAVQALDGVDLAVAPHERFCLLGPSGSGKTTLLRLIAGFEQPDEGHISLDGEAVNGLPPERRNVGVVFQDYALFEHRTVFDNVAFGLRMRGVAAPQRRSRVEELLGLVRLEGLGRRRPRELSGGQRQRVALARALAPEPRLLLLDEPLANLDRRLRETLRHEILSVQAAVGVTTILVTHDQEEALSFADRIAILDHGRLEQVGTPVQLWREPASRFVAGFLGEMNLLRVGAVSGGRAELVLAGDTVSVPVAGEVPQRATVACVRPEAMALGAAGTDGSPGRIERADYTGGAVTFVVALADGTSVLSRDALPDGQPAWRQGDHVSVTVQPVACRLLP